MSTFDKPMASLLSSRVLLGLQYCFFLNVLCIMARVEFGAEPEFVFGSCLRSALLLPLVPLAFPIM